MRITETLFRREVEITPTELKDLYMNLDSEGDVWFLIIEFIKKICK